MYYYVYNLQGDVTHIIDATGAIKGTYQYDAWGKITNLSSLTDAAQANPFRYRGYYYDTESGLYYLNSRYYNAEWGRFINADDYTLVTVTPNALYDKNLYAYCDNNPISRLDSNGQIWTTIGSMAIGGVIGAGIGAISSAVTQQILTGTINLNSVGVAAVTGFVSGAIAASPLGIVGQQIAGGAIGGFSYVADCYVNKKAIKIDEAILSVGMGVVSGRMGGPGANNKMVLSNINKSVKQTIAREARRSNQQYAKKKIVSTLNYRNNIFAITVWDSSFKFAVGSGISNGVSGKYSSWGLFPNLPSWKPWKL